MKSKLRSVLHISYFIWQGTYWKPVCLTEAFALCVFVIQPCSIVDSAWCLCNWKKPWDIAEREVNGNSSWFPVVYLLVILHKLLKVTKKILLIHNSLLSIYKWMSSAMWRAGQNMPKTPSIWKLHNYEHAHVWYIPPSVRKQCWIYARIAVASSLGNWAIVKVCQLSLNNILIKKLPQPVFLHVKVVCELSFELKSCFQHVHVIGLDRKGF